MLQGIKKLRAHAEPFKNTIFFNTGKRVLKFKENNNKLTVQVYSGVCNCKH